MVFPAPVAISHTNQKDRDPGIGCGVPGDNRSLGERGRKPGTSRKMLVAFSQ
jgi:hypothetical protein